MPSSSLMCYHRRHSPYGEFYSEPLGLCAIKSSIFVEGVVLAIKKRNSKYKMKLTCSVVSPDRLVFI
jgi:hypothetical protein